MNARFRGGFVQILHCIPGVRRCFCVRQCARGRSGSMGGTGFQLTGEKFDGLMPTDRLTRKPRIYIRCFIFPRCFSQKCHLSIFNMLQACTGIFVIFHYFQFNFLNVRLFYCLFASLLCENFTYRFLLMTNHLFHTIYTF